MGFLPTLVASHARQILEVAPFHCLLNLFFNIVGHNAYSNSPLHNPAIRQSGKQFCRIGHMRT